MIIRAANFAKNIFLSNFKRLPLPYKLTFALSYRCDSKCKICQIWGRKAGRELSTQEIEKFFQKNNYFNWIDLTGGEIFLRADLIEIVKAILANCKNLYLLHFPTNGFLTEKIVAETKSILELSPQRLIVTVSLDGPEKLHDELRGVRGSWIKAVETYRRLKKLKKKNFDVYLGMTLSKYNSGMIEETVKKAKRYIRDISYDDLHVNIAQTSGHFYTNVGVDLGADRRIAEEIEKFRRKKKKRFSGIQFLENRYQSLILRYVEIKENPLPCQALSASVFIDPYGNIYPCTIWDEKIGNLKDSDFELKKIWDSTKARKIRKETVENQCPACWTPCEAYQTILGNLLK